MAPILDRTQCIIRLPNLVNQALNQSSPYTDWTWCIWMLYAWQILREFYKKIAHEIVKWIDPSHKSHNALDIYNTVHHFVIKWNIVAYGSGALWDLCNRSVNHVAKLNHSPSLTEWNHCPQEVCPRFVFVVTFHGMHDNNKHFSQVRAPLVALREPPAHQNRELKVPYALKHKT